jgi:hypothetical protein
MDKLYCIDFELCFRICYQEGPIKKEGLELNGTHHLVYADDVHILCENINTIKKNTG